MRLQRTLVWITLLVLTALVTVGSASGAESAPTVRGVVLTGSVDPASAEFVMRRLRSADREDTALFLIEMDTPGGLSTSMRDIVKAIERADVPVAVWVGPGGSRAGSAGAYISAAADYLAMAPGTNIGSATPVSTSGDDLDRKVVNDAAAQIAALASVHGRNAEAFRRMVTEQLNLTADEAVAQKVAEAMVPSREALVASLDGTTIGGTRVTTAGADIAIETMPWYLRVLQVLIDPNLLAIMFVLGLAAIGFEIFHPGAIVPGITGAILLLLSFSGFAIVPFNWAGLAFIALAFLLFALEAVAAGYGALAAGGVVSLIIGGLILFDSAKGPAVSRPGLIIMAIAVGAGFTLVARAAWRARRLPQTTGAVSLVGHVAETRTPIANGGGHVFLDGELWAAHTVDGATIPAGRRVRVTEMHDLTLTVEPEPEADQS